MDETSMFDGGAGASVPANSSARVKELIAESVSLAETIEGINEALSHAQARFNVIKSKELPEALAELGTTEFVDPDTGFKAELSSFVSGSLPKEIEPREKAINWLSEHDGEGLIKTEVNLAFGKSEHNMAMDLVGRLRDEGFTVQIESGVHAQTLQAFARERLANGEDVDTEVLGLYVGNIAKVNKAKVKKTAPRKAK